LESRPSRLRANRAFQLLWAGQAFSGLGSRISAIAYPLLVLAMTGSPATAGLVGFFATVPYIIFQLPAGALVDRVDRKRLMIACDVVRGLALGSIALGIWLGRLTLIQVIIVAFIEGTLFVFFRLGEVAAIRRVVEPGQYPEALAQNEGRLRAAVLLGQPLGGLLFDIGRAVPFLADAVSYLFSLLSLFLIRGQFNEPPSTTRRHMLREIGEGFRWIWGQRFIFITVSVAAASNLLFQALVLVLIVAERGRGASASLIGLILAGFGVGGVVGSLSGSWLQRRLRPSVISLIAVWTWALLTPLIAVVANPILLAGVLALVAFVGPVWNVAMNTYYLKLVPDNMVGRVSSIGSLVSFGALPVGSLAGGLLLQYLSPTLAALILAAWMVLIALLATASPTIRRGPPVAPSPAAG
jgi:predicted MFS family arabinose efflux permease